MSDEAPGTLIHVDHGSRELWHHSVEFDGYSHTTACGQTFECERFDELRMDIGDWADFKESECCDECAGSVRSLEPAVADGGQSEDATDRGWTRDHDVSRNRRPRQRIEPEDWPDDRSGTVETTPAWRYACQECGEERRFASETPTTEYHCEECGQVRTFEALGELIYPNEGDDA